MNNNYPVTVIKIALVLTLATLMLGAYTRLSDAGLGCPDWPGCYGKLIVPHTADDVSKAWIEMTHRYAAAIIGIIIIYIFIKSLVNSGRQFRILSGFILLMVILQALLGMFTVTKLVHPGIVTLHLLGGMLTFCLLFYLLLQTTRPPGKFRFNGIFAAAIIAVILIFAQIALGGWVSTNYAALACPDFPGCNQRNFFPDFSVNAFNFFMQTGVNYEGGTLPYSERTAIHMSHRIGAAVTLIFCLILSYKAGASIPKLRAAGFMLGGIILVQVAIGIANIYLHLPLYLAVLHNGVAAVTLLGAINLAHASAYFRL